MLDEQWTSGDDIVKRTKDVVDPFIRTLGKLNNLFTTHVDVTHVVKEILYNHANYLSDIVII